MTPEDVKYIVVHCSKTSKHKGDGLDVVERKCRMRGALSIGYHFVISRDGTIQKGRPLTEAGNHARGYNTNSIAVCLVGLPKRATSAQKASLYWLIDLLQREFPAAEAVTHEDIQPREGKDCPGFKLRKTRWT